MPFARSARSAPPAPCLLALCLLAWSALPSRAAAEVRRCVMPGGSVVHTDRNCGSLGGIEQARSDPGETYPTRLYHGRCAATVPDLLYELTTAIDSQDVNRLAAAYHWPGLSGQAANATMDRLDDIAGRPLLDLRVLTADVVPAPAADDPLAWPVHDVRPTGVRVEQVRPGTNVPVTTVFGLRKHLGCWWVQL
ncbi:MAG TPA: hypothetical protein VFM73_07595 [Xanthomonadaceae bacterium]|nr:hypothetical protein [Xanthomonadaceae bacterium]